MGNTVLGLFGVCLAATLSELLLPGEEGRGTRQALRVLTALAVVLLLIRPVLPYCTVNPSFSFEGLIGESEDKTQEYEEIFSRAVQAGSEQELKAALTRLLASEYGIAEDDVYIKVYFDSEGELLRTEIYLSGLAILKDPDKIAADIGARLGCETEVR